MVLKKDVEMVDEYFCGVLLLKVDAESVLIHDHDQF